jgi:hypothetical protein
MDYHRSSCFHELLSTTTDHHVLLFTSFSHALHAFIITKRQRLFGTALSLMQAALGWLMHESNVSKAELEDLQQLLEQVKRQCAKSKELPGIAVRDLKMKQVESIFKIQTDGISVWAPSEGRKQQTRDKQVARGGPTARGLGWQRGSHLNKASSLAS